MSDRPTLVTPPLAAARDEPPVPADLLARWQAICAPQAAGGFLGAPFVWGGRGPTAWDCWGLVAAVSGRLGRPLPDDWASLDPRHGAALAAFATLPDRAARLAWAPVERLAPGDVVTLSSHRRIHHAGIASPWGVLHASQGYGVIIQGLGELRRAGYRLIQGYRYQGPVTAPEAVHG